MLVGDAAAKTILVACTSATCMEFIDGAGSAVDFLKQPVAILSEDAPMVLRRRKKRYEYRCQKKNRSPIERPAYVQTVREVGTRRTHNSENSRGVPAVFLLKIVMLLLEQFQIVDARPAY